MTNVRISAFSCFGLVPIGYEFHRWGIAKLEGFGGTLSADTYQIARIGGPVLAIVSLFMGLALQFGSAK